MVLFSQYSARPGAKAATTTARPSACRDLLLKMHASQVTHPMHHSDERGALRSALWQPREVAHLPGMPPEDMMEAALKVNEDLAVGGGKVPFLDQTIKTSTLLKHTIINISLWLSGYVYRI